MKLIKIVTHPYIIIISFFIILINGEGFGGFYLLYLLMGLPYGAIHSLLAFFGIVILLFAYYKFRKKKERIIECLTEIFAVFLLILSLSAFFYNDKQHYNYGTFTELVPVIMLILFLLIAMISILTNILMIYKNITSRNLQN
jgi:integral membrane sensor domain MASE1